MRACPRCNNTAVIEDGYCGVCRECTMPSLAASTGSAFRVLCATHPDVNYKTAWGCPECVREMRQMLIGAVHALRAYQYGNASPDLAESVADSIERKITPNNASERTGADNPNP
jgi:hypothetical protein